MKTSRIKNIIILILGAANVFLLLLLLVQFNQQRSGRVQEEETLCRLYAAASITLSPGQIPPEQTLPVLTPVRSNEREAALAQALLGDSVQTESSGGLRSFSNAAGTCVFRAGGSFSCSFTQAAPPSAAVAADALRSGFGYDLSLPAADFTGTLTGRQHSGYPLLNCTVTLTVQQGRLTATEGVYVPLEDAAEEEAKLLTPVTALLRFLDHRNTSGIICTEVTDVSAAYLLQSTASVSQRLTPVLWLSTDESDYYVNLINGEIVRL